MVKICLRQAAQAQPRRLYDVFFHDQYCSSPVAGPPSQLPWSPRILYSVTRTSPATPPSDGPVLVAPGDVHIIAALRQHGQVPAVFPVVPVGRGPRWPCSTAPPARRGTAWCTHSRSRRPGPPPARRRRLAQVVVAHFVVVLRPQAEHIGQGSGICRKLRRPAACSRLCTPPPRQIGLLLLRQIVKALPGRPRGRRARSPCPGRRAAARRSPPGPPPRPGPCPSTARPRASARGSGVGAGVSEGVAAVPSAPAQAVSSAARASASASHFRLTAHPPSLC